MVIIKSYTGGKLGQSTADNNPVLNNTIDNSSFIALPGNAWLRLGVLIYCLTNRSIFYILNALVYQFKEEKAHPLIVQFVSYQQVKSDEDGARGEADLCPG